MVKLHSSHLPHKYAISSKAELELLVPDNVNESAFIALPSPCSELRRGEYYVEDDC